MGDTVQLKRRIGLLQGVSIIVGYIIGSGIFMSPVGVLRNSETVGVAFVMWLACGLFSLIGAVVYAELGVTIPRSGGEYIYILTTFGPLTAFVSLWATFISYVAGIAANSMIFAEYILQPMFKACLLPQLPVNLLAVLAILTLCAVNCYNVTWATKIAVVFTSSKVLATVIVIVIGVMYLVNGNVESFESPFAVKELSPGQLALAFYHGFWAFAGWCCLNFLTEELKNPERNLPAAIAISMGIVTLIYLLVNVAFLAVLSPREMMASTAVAVAFAEVTMGRLAFLMPVFVGLSVFGSMNSEILIMSRLVFVGAREGHMPPVLAMVSYKYLTPTPSVIFLFVLILCFQMSGQLHYLIELSGFSFCIVAGMAVACVLYLRHTKPDLPRPLKLPIFVHVSFLLMDLFILLLSVYQRPREFILSLLIMGLAFPVYWLCFSWKNKPSAWIRALESITLRVQKLLQVVSQ